MLPSQCPRRSSPFYTFQFKHGYLNGSIGCAGTASGTGMSSEHQERSAPLIRTLAQPALLDALNCPRLRRKKVRRFHCGCNCKTHRPLLVFLFLDRGDGLLLDGRNVLDLHCRLREAPIWKCRGSNNRGPLVDALQLDPEAIGDEGDRLARGLVVRRRLVLCDEVLLSVITGLSSSKHNERHTKMDHTHLNQASEFTGPPGC